MTGAGVSVEVLRHVGPLCLPQFRRGFDTLDHFAGLDVGNFKPQQVVDVGIDARRVVIDDEGTNVIRERDRLESFHGGHVAYRHGHAVGSHKNRVAIGAQPHVVREIALRGLDLAFQRAVLGVDHIPEVLQVGAHHQRLAVRCDFGTLAAGAVVSLLPDFLVGTKIEGSEAAASRQIDHVGGAARGDS